MSLKNAVVIERQLLFCSSCHVTLRYKLFEMLEYGEKENMRNTDVKRPLLREEV